MLDIESLARQLCNAHRDYVCLSGPCEDDRAAYWSGRTDNKVTCGCGNWGLHKKQAEIAAAAASHVSS